MKLHRLKSKAAFTLVEVLVVVVIIGILAGLVVPTFTGYMDTQNEKTCVSCRQTLYKLWTVEHKFNKTLTFAYFLSHLDDYDDADGCRCPSGGSHSPAATDTGDYLSIACSCHADG